MYKTFKFECSRQGFKSLFGREIKQNIIHNKLECSCSTFKHSRPEKNRLFPQKRISTTNLIFPQKVHILFPQKITNIPEKRKSDIPAKNSNVPTIKQTESNIPARKYYPDCLLFPASLLFPFFFLFFIISGQVQKCEEEWVCRIRHDCITNRPISDLQPRVSVKIYGLRENAFRRHYRTSGIVRPEEAWGIFFVFVDFFHSCFYIFVFFSSSFLFDLSLCFVLGAVLRRYISFVCFL